MMMMMRAINAVLYYLLIYFLVYVFSFYGQTTYLHGFPWDLHKMDEKFLGNPIPLPEYTQ